jgi:hypothetical protein
MTGAPKPTPTQPKEKREIPYGKRSTNAAPTRHRRHQHVTLSITSPYSKKERKKGGSHTVSLIQGRQYDINERPDKWVRGGQRKNYAALAVITQPIASVTESQEH